MKNIEINVSEILGLAEAAKMLNISTTALSNLRKRDINFPEPFESLKSGPIWKVDDVYQYGIKTGRINKDQFISPCLYTDSKTIAMLGRARVGKSYITSMFAYKTSNYRNFFCSGGSDKTVCPVNNIFVDTVEDFSSFVEFSSSFYNDFKEFPEYEDLCSDVEFIDKMQVSLDDTEKLSAFIKKIEDLLEKISIVEKQYEEQNPNKFKKSVNFINVYSKPSSFCKNIMRKSKIKRLEIVDTPGVSGKVEFTKISKADLYIFVLNDANKDEAKTLKKIVTKIKPYVATSSACFLYRSNGFISTKEKFYKEQEKVKESMMKFESLFDDLKENIISTTMEILHPAQTCLCFPPMDPDELTLPEELFCEEFSEKIIKAFSNTSEEFLYKEYKKTINEQKITVYNYIKSILENIPEYPHNTRNDYLQQFIKEKHDRVKTNDKYRIVKKVDIAYTTEKEHLYNYFKNFTLENCTETWKQHVIKYLYHMLSKGVTRDCGLGIGTYYNEDNPALTMIVAESILAEQILNEFSIYPNKTKTLNYKNSLANNGITSRTWENVYCTDNDLMIKKLQLINQSLKLIPTNSLYDLVLCRYIGGLRKMTEYSILREFFTNDFECENIIKSFKF